MSRHARRRRYRRRRKVRRVLERWREAKASLERGTIKRTPELESYIRAVLNLPRPVAAEPIPEGALLAIGSDGRARAWPSPIARAVEQYQRDRAASEALALLFPPPLYVLDERPEVHRAAEREAERLMLLGIVAEARAPIGSFQRAERESAAYLEELDALADRVRREPGCLCQWEPGDSPCPVHGDEDA